jgi:hypothetical protein
MENYTPTLLQGLKYVTTVNIETVPNLGFWILAVLLQTISCIIWISYISIFRLHVYDYSHIPVAAQMEYSVTAFYNKAVI